MSQSTQTIAFATNLDDDEPALATATALAAASGARIVTVHATTGEAPPADRMARAAALAERWSVPVAHDAMAHSCCDDVTDTLLDALRRVGPTLIVTGTHGRTGLAQLLAGSVAEAVARNVRVPTLMVPLGGPGLADPRTGAVDLRTIVVPAGDRPATEAAVRAAVELADMTGARAVELVLAHVEDGTPAPAIDPASVRPARAQIRLTTRAVPRGAIETAIAALCRELDACVVVMATRGHDGVADAMGGSHTERVVRLVDCPVLAVPIG